MLICSLSYCLKYTFSLQIKISITLDTSPDPFKRNYGILLCCSNHLFLNSRDIRICYVEQPTAYSLATLHAYEEWTNTVIVAKPFYNSRPLFKGLKLTQRQQPQAACSQPRRVNSSIIT